MTGAKDNFKLKLKILNKWKRRGKTVFPLSKSLDELLDIAIKEIEKRWKANRIRKEGMGYDR